MSRYEDLKCERCKNRFAKLRSKQGQYCETILKAEEPASCPRFNLDKNAKLIWN